MNKFPPCRWAALALLVLPTATGADLTTQVTAAGDWVVRWRGQTVCGYDFHANRKKPYVRELAAPGGVNILRDSPADHQHHHALMYGIWVNGVNFWEEAGNYGLEKPTATRDLGVRTGRGSLAVAGLRQELDWTPASADAKPLLRETRTLRVSVDAASKELALVWHSTFRLAPGVDRVKLDGANYHGLGMRFLQPLDPLAVHRVAGETLDLSNNRQDVRPGTWAAVSFDRAGAPATVVLAGSPANRGAPAHFFSMLTPFAYLSATQNLDRQPLEYVAGQEWTLTYLVLLYPDVKPDNFIQTRVARWTAAQQARQPQ